MTLPLVIHPKNRARMFVVGALVIFCTYMIPNHFHYFKPQLLPLSRLDLAIPLVPWTVFIYTSEYVFFLLSYILLSNDLNRNRYLWTFIAICICSMFIFGLFPTTFPRDLYPIPKDTAPFVAKYFANLRLSDDPSNSFPSQHVCCCYLTAFAFLPRSEARWKLYAALFWATAVAVSTLTTKQHYLIDVIAGLTMAGIASYFFYVKVDYVAPVEFRRRAREVFSRVYR